MYCKIYVMLCLLWYYNYAIVLQTYFRSVSNVFDFLITVLSLLELIIQISVPTLPVVSAPI